MKVTLEGTFHILSHISDVDGRPIPYFIFPALYHVFYGGKENHRALHWVLISI